MTINPLVGRWRLVTWSARDARGGISYPFGEHAEGSLVYTPGGWMTGHLACPGRRPLATSTLSGDGDAQRAEAFSSYVAYCGTYEMRDQAVIHHVTMSLFPNWVGTQQIRYYQLLDDELVLTATASGILGGDDVVSELRWAREERL